MTTAKKITMSQGTINVPDYPIIPYIEGDGTGPDIWQVAVHVFDIAVEKAYGDQRKIHWDEVLAGEKSYRRNGDWLPQSTLDTIKSHLVAIKGP